MKIQMLRQERKRYSMPGRMFQRRGRDISVVIQSKTIWLRRSGIVQFSTGSKDSVFRDSLSMFPLLPLSRRSPAKADGEKAGMRASVPLNLCVTSQRPKQRTERAWPVYARDIMRLSPGLKAPDVTAWAGASNASAGPGQPPQKSPKPCKESTERFRRR
jgi:hypothetical protein